MLTHYRNFFCSLGEKDPFKTDESLIPTAFRRFSYVLFVSFLSHCDSKMATKITAKPIYIRGVMCS